MTLQLIELLFFVGLAFFLVNKLVSMLGSTDDNDPTKNSYFGQNSSTNGSKMNSSQMKDVTNNDYEDVISHKLRKSPS